jgi:branched-chain amino acid transport system ATP-binding protein
MLELANVHTYYGEVPILHGISLEVETGSVVALLGRNGMGKTTTVRSIIGFTPPRAPGWSDSRGTRFKGFRLIRFARWVLRWFRKDGVFSLP